MEINDLHCFTAAADAGSFSSAGKALGRSPSTLSRHIGRLEDELGLPLFERRHGGVLLTSGGKAVLGHVRRALAEINLIKAAALKNGAATVGEVRLGVRIAPIGGPISRLLTMWRANHPELDAIAGALNSGQKSSGTLACRLRTL
jgi:DNA-binding transcriptional LysR family regulator